MNYPLIKKFLPELKIVADDYNNPEYVVAKDLEAELAKGVEVFGNRKDINNAGITTDEVEGVDTHSGLLIGYQPLKNEEPVSREELIDLLQDLRSSMNVVGGEERLGTEISLTDKILKRILENGVK